MLKKLKQLLQLPTTTNPTTTKPTTTKPITETFDGPPPTTTTTIPEATTTTSSTTTTTTTTSSTTTTTTTTTIPTYEQATDMELPEDELDLNGNEVENNIVIDNTYDGQFGLYRFLYEFTLYATRQR